MIEVHLVVLNSRVISAMRHFSCVEILLYWFLDEIGISTFSFRFVDVVLEIDFSIESNDAL